MSAHRLLAVLLALAASTALAHEGHESHGAGAADPSPLAREIAIEDPARAYFTDNAVVNQDHQRLRFYTDLLEDKVVLLSFFYTSCPDFCPLMMDKLARVRELLEPQERAAIRFVSISVDPEQDTPARLRAFAERFEVGPGWDLVSGEQASLDEITSRLGQYTDDAQSHTTLLLAGNVPGQRWMKLRPDTAEPLIAAWLRELAGTGAGAS
jgi:protein SCO1